MLWKLIKTVCLFILLETTNGDHGDFCHLFLFLLEFLNLKVKSSKGKVFTGLSMYGWDFSLTIKDIGVPTLTTFGLGPKGERSLIECYVYLKGPNVPHS